MDDDIKYIWGKYKNIKGEMKQVWSDRPMTRDEMKNWDDTYRHMSKQIKRNRNARTTDE